eukprot:CAMPEP_0181080226 /NCGR_PEP_ID=MMETSP1071-20121207/2453_1 /TAXON_ID=35127 /ORGANISM="Thalassiosira sp., Strain NH16" /LENGTH=196 /DNA_ID=CAMNT_0023161687 /DNA_START=1224 /DNA_END=1815 /DNA_ORIENTATION=+
MWLLMGEGEQQIISKAARWTPADGSPCGIGLVPRFHAGHDADAAPRAARYQGRLRGDVVDRVNHHVPLLLPVGRVHHRPVLRGVARVHFHDRVQREPIGVGAYPPQMIAQHGRLGQADVLERRHRVTVQAAQRDLVEVHEAEVADAGAREHVGGVGSDSAEADDEEEADVMQSMPALLLLEGGEVDDDDDDGGDEK